MAKAKEVQGMKHEREYFKLHLAGKFNTFGGLNEHMKMLMSQRGWRATKGSGRMKTTKQGGGAIVYRHMEDSECWHKDIRAVWNDINDKDIYTGL